MYSKVIVCFDLQSHKYRFDKMALKSMFDLCCEIWGHVGDTGSNLGILKLLLARGDWIHCGNWPCTAGVLECKIGLGCTKLVPYLFILVLISWVIARAIVCAGHIHPAIRSSWCNEWKSFSLCYFRGCCWEAYCRHVLEFVSRNAGVLVSPGFTPIFSFA